ncbi:MAG: hypothetical protein M3Y80_00200 [Verrucomicrobiota bacterium]|nr:hypothetical protein [Verrucomicrobiota bacterium]
MNRTPFVPFTVRTVSGARLPVPHHDFAWLTPSGRRMFVAVGEDSVEMLDVLMIESIEQPAEQL